MPPKVTILVENCASPATTLMGEHGFAALIETEDFCLLFDTGQGKVIIPNLEALGIDLIRVNAVSLSHGHYDHAGGLPAVLKKTGKIPVYLGEAAFAPKYALLPNGADKWIGMPGSREELEKEGADFQIVEGPRELSPRIILTGSIPRVADFESVEPILVVEKEGEKVPDLIPEDQAVILKGEKGITVLTGCAHAGMVNTLWFAQKITGADKIHGLIGGTHLLFASDERIEKTVAALRELGVEMLAPSHCTGFRATAELHRRVGELMMPGSAGMIFRL
jgi:7,8-dihydropterin-6-yl-methyl-4-(beta-D-ribofuranosyl)aminobenzene 5'-phosphate synthase